ncbi:hypothetical protein HHK36_007246 [Tetracentron sinense]|uniref:RING-CH-type domain-containing protein n=1 Tax=Tetracentron sinense TaxID=13715 RepID=A0A834ZIL2_TETSI|nr:hypothetical protein HHK36_007246 [Tetracentron sinense]
MSDHLVLYVDGPITPATVQSMQGAQVPGSSGESSCVHTAVPSGSTIEDKRVEEHEPNEEESLIQTVECRICQEEDHIKNFETPCACSGSLKIDYSITYTDGHILCSLLTGSVFSDGAMRKEILLVRSAISHTNLVILPHRLYLALKIPPSISGKFNLFLCFPSLGFMPSIDILDCLLKLWSEGWTISGNPVNLHDPRLLAMAAAERHFLEAEYDEYAATNASGAAFCRFAALILMALLLLRHALTMTDPDGDDDASAFFSIFLLRAAGFLLPCYIMAWVISVLQRRRQREEAAALAATEVAIVLQSGQRRGLHVTIAPGPAVTSHQEPIQ